jgi:endonuclease YncB( thermonuclease family)
MEETMGKREGLSSRLVMISSPPFCKDTIHYKIYLFLLSCAISSLFLETSTLSQDTERFIFLEAGEVFLVSVIGVVDGDTIDVVKEDGTELRIRLLGVNTPDWGEPFSDEAKDFTEDELQGREVELWVSRIEGQEKDSYGRTLGVVVVDGVTFNPRLLSMGLATRCFMKNDLIRFPRWEEAEVRAREEGLGLWVNIGREGVVINEVNPNPDPELDREAEFVELYNKGGKEVDLSGWRMGSAGQIEIPEGVVIGVKGYVIIARCSQSRFREIYPATPLDVQVIEVGDCLNLPNDFDPPQALVVHLRSPDGAYQDSLTYSLLWDEAGADGTGRTLERIDPNGKNLGDSRLGGLDDEIWNPSLLVKGTPGRANSVFQEDNTPPIIHGPWIDGREFLSGDYVSRTPIVLCEIRDTGTGVIKSQIRLSVRNIQTGREVEIDPNLIYYDQGTSEMTYSIKSPLEYGRYRLYVSAKDRCGNEAPQRWVEFVVCGGLEIQDVINHPNPMSDYTHFTYTLTSTADSVMIEIYTIGGRLIKKIRDAPGDAGYNKVHWDGRDDRNRLIANGVYLYRIVARYAGGLAEAIERLVILR